MKRMNRREFLSVVGGASALTITAVNPAFAGVDTTPTIPLYVKGLVMFDFESPEIVRIGFPKAPGHRAMLSIVPQNGAKRSIPWKGRGTVEAKPIASADPKIFVPELIRMKEFYGPGVKSRIDQCPGVLTIPSNTIRSITTSEISKERFAFYRKDNDKEVNSFRPRQIAEIVKIDLSSAGILKLDGGKMNIPLETTRELQVALTTEGMDLSNMPPGDHFAFYFPYVERPAALDFDVVPKRVGAKSSPAPRVGHHFMMLDWVVVCGPCAIP